MSTGLSFFGSLPTPTPIPYGLPGDGWYAEFLLNGQVTFLRLVCFILDGWTTFSPPQYTNPPIAPWSPRVTPMVSTNQSIVPATVIPGFVRLIHESELEEEAIDDEEYADEYGEEDEYEGEDEGEEEERELESCSCPIRNNPLDGD